MLDIVSRVRAYCDKNDLLETDALIVGVSGGPDSVALLHIISRIFHGTIIAVHVNHNLRPGDCDSDMRLVEELCKSLDITLKVYSFDVNRSAQELKKSVEETGRILRYQAFDDAALKLGIKNYKVAVAHHSGDVSETMMMNLFRGAGLDGLVSPRCERNNVIRPLLTCSKEELITYLNENNISYAVDKTNLENDHTRNIWRNELFPKIAEATVKKPQEALLDTYNLLSRDIDFIDGEANKLYEEAKKTDLLLDVNLLNLSHSALSSRVLRNLWKDTFGNLTDFESVNLEIALRAVNEKSNTVLSMPFDRVFFIARGLCGFCSEHELEAKLDLITANMRFCLAQEDICIEIGENFTLNLPNNNILIKLEIIENKHELGYNDYSWFLPVKKAQNLIISNNLGEFEFRRAGAKGHKQLRRIFTDMKVPEVSRKKILGIRRGNEVLFVPGIGHGEGFVSPESWERYSSENETEGPFLKIEFGGN